MREAAVPPPGQQSKRPQKGPRSRYYSLLPSRLGRGSFLKWLRRVHAWLGLWGAVLGILFGVTGILLNHRSLMKIPLAKYERRVIQFHLPQPLPANPEAFAVVLKRKLNIEENSRPVKRIMAAPPRTVVWGGQEVRQPEQWRVIFVGPQQSILAEYWVGNSFVTVKRRDANIWAFLNSLHRASGVNAAWVLLADSIAGSFIVLSLTGILLWTRLNGPRLLAAGLGLGSLLLAIWFAWQSM